MPIVDLRVMKRSLVSDRVPVEAATLTVRAVRKDGPLTQVDGADVVFSFLETVNFADGTVSDQIWVPPTDGTYGYEWEIVAESQLLFTRLTEAPDVSTIPFGELGQLNRETLEPTETILDAWESVATRAEADAAAATAAAADVRARTLTATVDPTDPHVLILTYPVFMLHPDGKSLLIPVEVTS